MTQREREAEALADLLWWMFIAGCVVVLLLFVSGELDGVLDGIG